MNYYFCDACRYCFSAEKLPDRCPDCGAVAHNNKKAVRPASKTEIEELLKIQKEDKEDTLNIGHSAHLPAWQGASTQAARN